MGDGGDGGEGDRGCGGFDCLACALGARTSADRCCCCCCCCLLPVFSLPLLRTPCPITLSPSPERLKTNSEILRSGEGENNAAMMAIATMMVTWSQSSRAHKQSLDLLSHLLLKLLPAKTNVEGSARVVGTCDELSGGEIVCT